MRIIDPHLHVDRMKGKEVETISIAGVEAGVLPTPHLLPWMVSSETLLRMWRQYLDFGVKHAKSLGIELYVTLGIPFYGMDTESIEECLKQLPNYIEHERVVGLGEIGLDAGIEDEVRLFKAQASYRQRAQTADHCAHSHPDGTAGGHRVGEDYPHHQGGKFPLGKSSIGPHRQRNTEDPTRLWSHGWPEPLL